MDKCGKDCVHLVCGHCLDHRKIPLTCQIRICDKCETQRKSKFRKRYNNLMGYFKHPKMVTLTKRGHNLMIPEVKQKLFLECRAFEKLMRENGYGFNGIRVLEMKVKDDGLYYHIHYMIDYKGRIPQAKISEMWEKVTGSYVCWINRVGRRKGSEYVLKYITKPFSLESKDKVSKKNLLLLYATYFYKSRMITKIGSFYGLTVAEVKFEWLCRNCKVCTYDFYFHFEEPFDYLKKELAEQQEDDWGDTIVWDYLKT